MLTNSAKMDKAAEIVERQFNMYGMTETEIQSIVREQFFGDSKMAAVSILSDAQGLMEFGESEKARQAVNVAKYIVISQMNKTVTD